MLIYFGHWPACWGIIWFAQKFGGLSARQTMESPMVFLIMLAGSILPALLLQRPYDKFCGDIARRLGAYWIPASMVTLLPAESSAARRSTSESASAARLTGEIV